MLGKKLRLSKIFNQTTQRTCIVPMDHGITMGPIDGLTNSMDTVKAIAKGGANAIILNKGMFRELENMPEVTTSRNFLLHISASTNLSSNPNLKSITSTVLQAVKLGAIGVSIHINLGCEYDAKMISDFGMVADECMEWGMPLLAMMYINGEGKNPYDAKNIAHLVKFAEEMGADIVKVNCPSDIKDIYDITRCVNIPVVISGGPKKDTMECLSSINNALEYGARGVSIGRNVFQSSNPELTTRVISDLVHKRISYKDAVMKISEESNSKIIINNANLITA
jgi:predicted phospho-2-dehydro-3-deoxyheptonate aldolase